MRAPSSSLGIVPVSLFLAACGPEHAALPPTGIYRLEAVTLENSCDPYLDDNESTREIVEVREDAVLVPYSDFLGIPVCSSCVAARTWAQLTTNLDPDSDRYVWQSAWQDDGACLRQELVEVEILDETSLRASLTNQWRESNGCPWKGATAEGCTVVREYTYTLIDACDDCSFPLAASQN